MNNVKHLCLIHGLTEDSKIFLVCYTNLNKGEVKSILKQHLTTTNDKTFTKFRHSGIEIIKNFIDINLSECL